ncbi:uncharacterized protein LOC135100114 [Scylla paramamosain]|uniref:uncharacterized protein LOC135100114 n=1 Tax=Scylla paramamosain TaxID=85552 RepID=UPI00308326C0
MKTKVLELSDNNNLTTHPPPQQQPPTTEVSAVNHQRRAWSRSAPSRAGPGRSQKRCKGCGDSGCGGTDKCPARDATCRNCGRKGHFWGMCCALTPGRGPATSNAVIVGGVEATADLSVRIVCPWPQAECCTTAVADTGAQVCIAGRPLLESLGIPLGQLHASPRTVSHVAGGGVKLLGSLTCEVRVGAITTSECVYIAEGVQRLYLSLGACRALQLVPQDFPRPATRISALTAPASLKTSAHPLSPPYELVEENLGRLEKWLLEEFGRTVFATERTPLPEILSPPHHIHLRPGARPHVVHVPATVPHHFYNEVRRQLDDDIARGIIEEVPAGEPTEWCARMVVAPKKNGTPFDLISSVSKHTFKTVADAYSGYHQIPLDSESRKLTTFITPWGRFRYRRTPMGHCAAQDAFTKRLDDVMSDVPRKIKCVDDTLLHDKSVAEAFWHTYGFLQKCRDNGVTLRSDKFSFCKRNVTFAGYLLGWEDYQPSHDLIKSITEFMMPASPSLTDNRLWKLLKKPAGKTVYWDDTLDAIKNLAAEGLKFYDTSRPTGIPTDYSRQGCKNLTFITDHKALSKIFGDKELKDIHNPRILNIKERTLMYNFRVKYIKGKSNCAADDLSRYPALASVPEDSDEADDEAVCAVMVVAAAETTTDNVGHVVDLRHVEEEAVKDEEYRLLHECVANDGWGERKDAEPAALRPYFRMRRHLSCQGDIVLYTSDERFPPLVIPTALRRTVLANLHAGHQGRDSMLRRARQSVYCPGIDAEVEQKRRQCQMLTGWLEVEHLSGEATSSRLITLFRRWFTRFGIPEELVTKYLNTPLHGLDASPAQLPTGKQLRDAIPVESSRYLINEQWGRTLRDRERAMIQTSVNSSIQHDQQAHSLTPLRPGQRARIQKPI